MSIFILSNCGGDFSNLFLLVFLLAYFVHHFDLLYIGIYTYVYIYVSVLVKFAISDLCPLCGASARCVKTP